MSCCHPFKAFKTGYKTVNGKDDYVLATRSNVDVFPLDKAKKPVLLDQVPHKIVDGHAFLTDPLDVPCGCCVGCRMQRAKEWKIRNCLELQFEPEAHFVTLTYDDEHIPINQDGEAYLCKRDFQLFMKKLRKYIGPFRYFACGEYGDRGRPHFHAILYGHLDGFRLIGPNRFTCDALAKCWSKGFHLVETVSPGAIAYVSGYVEKKQSDPNWFSYPVKPFLMMSRRPGIGFRYFVKHYDSIKDTKKVYGLFGNGTTSLVSSIPHSFRRYLDGFEWFQEYREKLHDAGSRMISLQKVVYGESDINKLQFDIEGSLNCRLKKVRNTTL